MLLKIVGIIYAGHCTKMVCFIIMIFAASHVSNTIGNSKDFTSWDDCITCNYTWTAGSGWNLFDTDGIQRSDSFIHILELKIYIFLCLVPVQL